MSSEHLAGKRADVHCLEDVLDRDVWTTDFLRANCIRSAPPRYDHKTRRAAR